MDSHLYHIPCNYSEIFDEQVCMFMIKRNTSLLDKLKTSKNKINNQKNWDVAKKFANKYEFIFSFNNDGVADIIPISRSYFKLVEILKDNVILEHKDDVVKAACLCEGPGGFIQAINDVYHSKHIQPIDCITLMSTDKKIPNWKLNSINNYKISYGKDRTGNLYDVDNIHHFVDVVGKNSCNLVTADGGFDFSKDFNSQEDNFLLLLLCEIYTCLNIQSEGGTFVLKVFDLFHEDTLNFVSLLRMFYETIIIQKPKTSRPANSEKYIICKNFSNNNAAVLPYVKDKIYNKQSFIGDVINKHLQYDTLKYIVNYNDTFVVAQMYHIEKTLHLIKTNHFNKKENLRYCIEWCRSYGIPIKHVFKSLI
ncbi:hypothetical protein QKU58_gp158 [Pyramimonas orientalis virus]|uniref:Ribosomal RNA methyltransferase FtsJ domain-containing protein n=1 Tax=Pyramimonas orientalis virus 01B TaxID=3134525 RepID=A0A7M4CER5_9VIRU|nr:hypothetical protein QKU58_gp158 [Pyramimonas orientalis virus]QOI90173.1 hypothetical protein HWQ62_00036 [Pyramimonas orientalis virus]